MSDIMADDSIRRRLVRIVREPLFQFIVIAAVLFALNGLLNPPDRRPPGDSVIISAGRVEQIAEGYRLLGGRAPSRAELDALVQDYVDEEIDYREAVAMGLDADDTVVRRRMRQKLEFLLEDVDAIAEPTDADLAAWLTTHQDEYRLPERRAIQQVLFNTDKRGKAAAADAAKALERLKGGADFETIGDSSMLPAAMALTSEEGVSGLFGPEFARKVFDSAATDWFGPVQSPFGMHLVRIVSREEGRAQSAKEIGDRLRTDWIDAKRSEQRAARQEAVRRRYNVKIEWPAAYATTTK
jgi:parvulin-like peptidyl-prolyl isomerase